VTAAAGAAELPPPHPANKIAIPPRIAIAISNPAINNFFRLANALLEFTGGRIECVALMGRVLS
jgi:hypothetical protein